MPKNLFDFDHIISVKKGSEKAQVAGDNSLILVEVYKSLHKNPLKADEKLTSLAEIIQQRLIQLDEAGNLAILSDPQRGMPIHLICIIFIEAARRKRVARVIARRMLEQSDKISTDNILLWGLFTLVASKRRIKKIRSRRLDVLKSNKMQKLFRAAIRRIDKEIPRKQHEAFYYGFVNKRKIEEY